MATDENGAKADVVKVTRTAVKVVDSILDDLTGRRGVGDELDGCDAVVRAEIRQSLITRTVRHLLEQSHD